MAKHFVFLLLAVFSGVPFTYAQQAPLSYTPPTHDEKFKTYLNHTFKIGSIVHAGVHAGIEQALDRPSQWQEGTKGYAERFASAMGHHAARGTATYAFGELFKEDLRYVHCNPNCSF